MNRYRIRQVTVGRYVKQQTRYYPQYQPEGENSVWTDFFSVETLAAIYFTSLAEAEDFLDNQVEEEVIHEYLPSEVHVETRFTTSIAREDDF
jgi:hypothetical protein